MLVALVVLRGGDVAVVLRDVHGREDAPLSGEVPVDLLEGLP